MNKIYIYGAGEYGKKLFTIIEEAGKRNLIIGFIDEHTSMKTCNSIPIYRISQIESRDADIIIAISSIAVMQEVYLNLKKCGFNNIYYAENSIITGNLKIFDVNKYSSLIINPEEEKPVLDYMEFQVADNCNLKCDCCAHFSNIVCDEKFASIELYIKDLNQMSQLFSGIETIRLMGGEPLLNKKLPKFVQVTREYFPYSDIHIVTNGILIPQVSDSEWEIYRKNRVVIDITQYPVTEKKFAEYLKIMREKNVRYAVCEKVDKFFVNLSRNGKEDYRKAYDEYCLSKMCHFLRKGRLYACPRIPMAYESQEFLGLQISSKELEESSVNINTVKSGWEILKKISNPVPLCRICTKTKFVSWSWGGELNPDNYYAD